jgi:plastocyanin
MTSENVCSGHAARDSVPVMSTAFVALANRGELGPSLWCIGSTSFSSEETAMHRRRLRALVLLPAVLAATVLAAAPPAAAGGGCHRPATEGRGTTLALTELCFSPNVLRVAPGTEVTIVNRDALTHPLGRPGGEWAWEGNVGDRVTVRLDRDGIYPFFCYAHPGMVGVVVAGDGRGVGTGVVEVADPEPVPAEAAEVAARPAPAGRDAARFPLAWLVALAALVGAAAGTRLRSRGPAA